MSNRPTAGKKKEDVPFDLEQQFILRMPPGPAMALRHDVETGAMNLKDKIFIEITHDMRHGTVRYGDQVFSAKLVDLPCVMESLKTTDSKTMYKTADIAQMLVCSVDDEISIDESDPPKKKDKDKKHQWTHGITPPLKNVRKRRFRKTLKKKYQEQPEIEKEVKRLFRADNEAFDVKWEVLVEDEHGNTEGSSSNQQVLLQGAASNTGAKPKNQDALEHIAEHDIFGEVSSSEEEDINIMDSADEMSRPDTPGRASMETDTMDSRISGFHRTDSTAQMGDMFSEEADNAELQAKMGELKKQLKDINQQMTEQKAKFMEVKDSTLKERIQRNLEKLSMEENEKSQEFEILSSMLTQS